MKRAFLLHDESAVSRFWDPVLGSYVTRVQPGFYTLAQGTEVVMTTVGAGICACVRDPELRIGGLAHFLLPTEDGASEAWNGTAVSTIMRFGNVAMEYLITAVCKMGGRRDRLELMVFGGANLATHMSDVAERHVAFIQAYAETEELPVIEQDTGNSYAREVAYYPGMGTVRVRALTRPAAQDIIEREQIYLCALAKVPSSDDVTLF